MGQTSNKSLQLSIVIPTLNEEAFIGRCLATAIKHARNLPEVIVVDAGSTDKTVAKAHQVSGVSVLVKPELKGKKYASLNTGAKMAKGEVLLFLDADTFLPEQFDDLIANCLNDPGTVGGAFEHQFDRTTPFLSGVERVNQLRYRISKRFFGDQALFCRRDIFESVGGFPSSPIMEAAHLCDRLKKFGKLRLAKGYVITSSRRFTGNAWKVFFTDTRIWMRDQLRLNLKSSGEKYWKVNDR